MAHNALIRSPVTNWTNASQITQSEVQTIDGRMAGLVNGDDGGTFGGPPAPTYSIGGQGISLTGPLRIEYGGALIVVDPLALQMLDGDYPQLAVGHTGRTHQVMMPCALARPIPRYVWHFRREDAALQSYAPTFDDSSGAGPVPARAFVPIRGHDTGTLGSVTVNFRIGFAHTALPSTMPMFRVMRMDASGNLVALTSTALGADASGYISIPKPASVSAWYAAGATQTFTVTCDQNNVVDVSQYDYFLEIVDQRGPDGYPFTLLFKTKVRLATVAGASGNQATLSGSLSIDGLSTATGDRILVKDQLDHSQNGIWIANAAQWTRAPDFQSASDFEQGMAVQVEFGAANGGSTWQVSPSVTSWGPGDAPAGITTWAPGVNKPLNDYAIPTSTHATGFFYQVSAIAGTGTTANPEPAWPTTIGQTVIDNAGGNQITWKCAGKLATPITWIGRPDDIGVAEGAAYLPHGTIFQSILVEFDNIADARFQ